MIQKKRKFFEREKCKNNKRSSCIESAFKSKLIDLLTQLKGFKFVLAIKKIESDRKIKYDFFYSNSNAEIIINESDINDVLELI